MIQKHINKNFHKKLIVRVGGWVGVGGVNVYAQPDRKISAFFYDSPNCVGKNSKVWKTSDFFGLIPFAPFWCKLENIANYVFYGVIFFTQKLRSRIFFGTNIKTGWSLSSKSACDNLGSLESLWMRCFLKNVDERWLLVLEQNIAKGSAEPRELSYFAMP